MNKLTEKRQYSKHGMTKTPLDRVFTTMKTRCYNPRCKQYKYYGGRGITICDEWLSDPASFFKWAAENGYHKGLEIDRENTNGHYEPSNCRWITHRDNLRNRRNIVKVSAFGETKLLSDWVSDHRCVVCHITLYIRIMNYKWPAEVAITTPPYKRRRQCRS